MLNSLLQMYLKLNQKEQFKKQQKQLGISLEITLLIKITRVSKTSPNNSERNEKEIRRDLSPELREKIIDDLRLKEEKF